MRNFVAKGESITITGPVGGLKSGEPYAAGKIPCVASVDIAQGAKGSAMTKGVFALPVHGYGDSANAAVAVGDAVYYDTDEINVDGTNGVLFGYALEAVTSGATTTIEVLVK